MKANEAYLLRFLDRYETVYTAEFSTSVQLGETSMQGVMG